MTTPVHFLKEADHTPEQWLALLDLAAELKAEKAAGTERRRLAGKNIALIFEKTSTRTRCAFEVAAFDQGAHTTALDRSSSQVGHKESMADTARVLGGMFDAIEYRGYGQDVIEVLARNAGVPVFNGLTDEWHPTQMLADQLTMREHGDKPLDQVVHAYVGDARFNMGNSCLVSGALVGMDIRIVAPAAYQPEPWVVEIAQDIARTTGATITITDDMDAGVRGCDFVSTDVWVSMGEPKEVWAERIDALKGYQVNAAVMAATGNPRAQFMHCLPAFHDRNTVLGEQIYQETGLEALEVTDEVFQSEASIVFPQAANRLHTIKAVMVNSLT